jgi:hypothetical protein
VAALEPCQESSDPGRRLSHGAEMPRTPRRRKPVRTGRSCATRVRDRAAGRDGFRRPTSPRRAESSACAPSAAR